jgi:hypothetical protein
MPHFGVSAQINLISQSVTPDANTIYRALDPIKKTITEPKWIDHCQQQHYQDGQQHHQVSQRQANCLGTPKSATTASHGYCLGQAHLILSQELCSANGALPAANVLCIKPRISSDHNIVPTTFTQKYTNSITAHHSLL